MIFDELKGILFVKNIKIPDSLMEYVDPLIDLSESEQGFTCIDRRLHKFPNDEVLSQKDGFFLFLDGHIDNKDEICSKNNETDWEEALFKEIHDGDVSSLRGGFCGIVASDIVCRLFVDQVGNRALYYYADGDKLFISTRLFFITELLKATDMSMGVDEQAVKYMLTLGFMADDSTICKEIKRVAPGDYVDITPDGRVNVSRYYRPDNAHIDEGISSDTAIEGIDHYFRQAIKREFDKDKEYGYQHLVDLSGGLDSRMTSWVAHDMGYGDQINVTYCRKDYLDFKIAQQIACDLRHRFVYMPLDDFGWFKDVEINTRALNAASLYAGSTGSRSLLDMMQGCNCGIEHTGMVGDAIIGTFYDDRDYNYARPCGNENVYSDYFKYQIPQAVLDGFENREQFSIYTRGLLGAQSSYLLRQNYFETASPFLDVDFLTFMMSVPFEYRKRHKIYLAWIQKKYPDAAEYSWEKWHGAKPKESSRRFQKKVMQLRYSLKSTLSKCFPGTVNIGMNPLDYWYANSPESKEFAEKYYRESLENCKVNLPSEICDDLSVLFSKGNVSEKEQVLTVCAAVKMLI